MHCGLTLKQFKRPRHHGEWTNEKELNGYNCGFRRVFRVILEMADKQALFEEPIELKGMPDCH